MENLNLYELIESELDSPTGTKWEKVYDLTNTMEEVAFNRDSRHALEAVEDFGMDYTIAATHTKDSTEGEMVEVRWCFWKKDE